MDGSSPVRLPETTVLRPTSGKVLTVVIGIGFAYERGGETLQTLGPGDFFGTRQAGVPTFRMIDLVRDREVLDTAQQEAARWFAKALPDAAGVERLIAGWEQRFRLVEIG